MSAQENPDQPAHSPQSDQNIHRAIIKGAKFLHADNEYTDQTARKRRLMESLLSIHIRMYHTTLKQRRFNVERAFTDVAALF